MQRACICVVAVRPQVASAGQPAATYAAVRATDCSSASVGAVASASVAVNGASVGAVASVSVAVNGADLHLHWQYVAHVRRALECEHERPIRGCEHERCRSRWLSDVDALAAAVSSCAACVGGSECSLRGAASVALALTSTHLQPAAASSCAEPAGEAAGEEEVEEG